MATTYHTAQLYALHQFQLTGSLPSRSSIRNELGNSRQVDAGWQAARAVLTMRGEQPGRDVTTELLATKKALDRCVECPEMRLRGRVKAPPYGARQTTSFTVTVKLTPDMTMGQILNAQRKALAAIMRYSPVPADLIEWGQRFAFIS